jgi:hypothetical protein
MYKYAKGSEAETDGQDYRKSETGYTSETATGRNKEI